MAGRVSPESSVGKGVDEILHVRRKWQENAGFFNLRSKNLLELIFEPGVCIREQKNENDIFSNYRNLICEILRRVLNDLQEHNQLPSDYPVLYLKIDNCGENKNKTLFAFLTDLVRRKVFVKYSWFPAAHTHDDIDQIFSTVSTCLGQRHILCPDQKTVFAQKRNSFKNEQNKPDLLEVFANEVFDNDLRYMPVLNPALAYYK